MSVAHWERDDTRDPGINATPEMIEAGRIAYTSYFLDLLHDEDGEVSRRMVTEVYVAMERRRKVSP
jgi:hypothetical protein